MPNRLARETSPYLRQHQDNPVDWYPWGEEALQRARAEQRPLLVSIGYSACHWCHVMAHESFEDPAIAELMNHDFVCIKVDREERPDVDAVCMDACQTMTGQGGWPLNAFLTPEQAPFFVGTYFPPEPRHGLASWRAVLEAVAAAWNDRREDIRASGKQVLDAIGRTGRIEPSAEPIGQQLLDDAVDGLRGSYDARNGGFARAPKFPMSSVLELLLMRGEHEMSLQTLRSMAQGGIYDQVGGGFARYAVDATWTVPHFEKMLYDNALLARAYLHGWQVSSDPVFKRVCTQTLDWALREMRSPEGGFYAALDADSEGIEGKFYVWTPEQLGDAAELFELAPFEHGQYVLRARDPVPDDVREQLYLLREQRVRPGLDDKQLTSWNALMISALAESGAALDHEPYLAAATRCAEFLLRDRQLMRTGTIPAFLDDYAYLVQALTTLYEATLQPRWYREAVTLADQMIERFADRERGGFFTTAADQETGFARRKDLEDSPIPSGNSAAAYGLLRLGLLSGDAEYERQALGVLRLLAPIADRHPLAFGHALQAFDFYLARVREVAIVGPEPGPLLGVVRGAYRPHLVLAGGEIDGVPLLDGRTPVGGRAAAYVCEHFACNAPVTTAEGLQAALD